MNIKLTPRVAALAASFAAWASSRQPASALPLSQVVQQLGRQGWRPFAEIEFDDGQWEAEVWKGRDKFKLKVDPANGRIVSERRDD